LLLYKIGCEYKKKIDQKLLATRNKLVVSIVAAVAAIIAVVAVVYVFLVLELGVDVNKEVEEVDNEGIDCNEDEVNFFSNVSIHHSKYKI